MAAERAEETAPQLSVDAGEACGFHAPSAAPSATEMGVGCAFGLPESPDAVLFASYGTTIPSERDASIDPVAHALALAFPESRSAQAYASGKVLRALFGTEDEMPGVAEALDRLSDAGARTVVVQPGHLVHGVSFDRLVSQVKAAEPRFKRVAIGEPLLSDEKDRELAAQVLSAAHAAQRGFATVLVGHGFARDEAAGRDPGSDNAFSKLGAWLRSLHRSDVLVGVMDVEPGSAADRACGFERVAADLSLLPGGVRKVTLAPLMLTAGRHARTQICGDGAESWRSRLQDLGYDVTVQLAGLGSFAGIRDQYVAHARAAWESAR